MKNKKVSSKTYQRHKNDDICRSISYNFFCNGILVLNMVEDILPYKFQLFKTQGTIASS